MSEAWVSSSLGQTTQQACLQESFPALAIFHEGVFSSFRYPCTEAETELLSLPLRLPHEGQDTASSQPSELALVDGPWPLPQWQLLC